MKPITISRLITFVVSLLAAGNDSFAQMNQSRSPGAMDAALVKLFGDIKAFSSQCETRMLDANQKETMSMTMDFALLDGKMRAELDMTRMNSAEMNSEAVATIKRMGMDRIVSIIEPAGKTQTQIYPKLKSSVTTAIPREQTEMLSDDAKIKKTELGKESVDGHPCVKNKVVVTSSKGKTQESTVWNAPGMKDFPIKIQTVEDGVTIVMLFKQVKLEKPDASKFEVPSGYKQYDSPQAFMQANIARLTGSATNSPGAE